MVSYSRWLGCPPCLANPLLFVCGTCLHPSWLGQPPHNGHQLGGVYRSPDEPFAQQEGGGGMKGGKLAVRGNRTCGGPAGQHVEEQGTRASRTRKRNEVGHERPGHGGVWTPKIVKGPLQRQVQPQYTNDWVPQTRKRHIMPHATQPQHTNHGAPQIWKQHPQKHRPQRLIESSNVTPHAKGTKGVYPRPRKETATRRKITNGESVAGACSVHGGHTNGPLGAASQGRHQRTAGGEG